MGLRGEYPQSVARIPQSWAQASKRGQVGYRSGGGGSLRGPTCVPLLATCHPSLSASLLPPRITVPLGSHPFLVSSQLLPAAAHPPPLTCPRPRPPPCSPGLKERNRGEGRRAGEKGFPGQVGERMGSAVLRNRWRGQWGTGLRQTPAGRI